MHYTAANLAWAQGADGMYTFNFPYYRFLHKEPPFHVFAKYKDKDWLREQDQHYWMPGWWRTGYNGRQFQLPQDFVVDTRKEFIWTLALPESGVKKAKLRLKFDEYNVAFGLTWDIRINGKACKAIKDTSEPFEHLYAGASGTKDWQYIAFNVPVEALKNGRNVISVRLEDGPINKEFDTTLTWMDLAVFAKKIQTH